MGRVLAVIAAALVWVAPAHGFSKENVRVPMSDGVELAATVYIPDGDPAGGAWPTIVMLHGLGQTRATSNAIAEAFFVPYGYAVLTYDARGHGESGGVNDLDGPREIADVRELLEWLGRRSIFDQRRLGGFGVSLGGGTLWRAAVEGLPFSALVPVTTWTDLYASLLPGNLAKSGAIAAFLGEIPAERFSPLVNGLRNDLLQSRNLEQLRALAAERSSLQLLGRVRAPVLMLQGRRDFPFDLGQVRAAWRRLSVAKRLYIGDLGHAPAANPPAEQPHFLTEAREWFDRWLRGLPNGIDRRPPIELAHDPWSGKTSSYRTWPKTRALQFAFGGRTTVGARGQVVRTARLPRRTLETFGAPTVRVTASTSTGWPRVVAVLTAVTPGGGRLTVSEGGAQTSLLGRRTRTITLRLIDQATLIPRGSRLRLTLATSSPDLLYLAFPLPETLKLTVNRVRLTLPVLVRPVSG